MSVESHNATAPTPATAPGAECIDPRRVAEDLAKVGGIDPRIPTLAPGFDAPFFQAGLAGYSDAAMRIIARRHGCPYCITEALLDRTILAGGRGFAKADLGELHDNVPGGDEDFPLAGQIMGSEPTEMATAAIKMIEQGRRPDKEYRALAYAKDGSFAPVAPPAADCDADDEWGSCDPVDNAGPDDVPDSPGPHSATSSRSFTAIDANLACPVKKISSKARGGHWLVDPAGAIRILEAVREAVPASILCTVKLRRAFDDTPEMASNCDRILEAAFRMGYAWATVHARTVQQKYVGPSRWDILREIVRRHPNDIIFGSGDIWNAADIFRMVAYTGVKAAAVARGCIGNPWLFRQARDMMAGRAPAPPTLAEQAAVLKEHYALLLAVNHGARYSEDLSSKQIRKFGIRFAAHHPKGEEVRLAMIGVKTAAEWDGVLRQHYAPDSI